MVDNDKGEPIDAKRLFFDWSFIIPLVAGAIVWGAANNTITRNSEEIAMLRAANATRAASDIRIAEQMATRADVQKVSDQVQALAAELRNRAGR